MQQLRPWLLTLLPTIATVVLWTMAKGDEIFVTDWTVAANQLSGLMALVVFTLVLLLSSKLRFLNQVFAGYDRIYYWHKFLGIAAFLFSISHYAFLVIDLFVHGGGFPEWLSKITGATRAEWVGVVSLAGITLLLILTYIQRLPYHIWKRTHDWMGLFFILGGAHSLMIASDTSRYLPLQIWAWFLVLFGTFCVVYARFLWRRFPDRYEYYVDQIVDREDTFDFYLKPSEATKNMEFYAGQFAFIKFENVGEAHPFSISSAPQEEYVRMSIKKLGDWTQKLDMIKLGDKATLNGPYGKFGHKIMISGDKPLTYIGGGIGITPMLSMLHYDRVSWTKRDIDVYYLTRNGEDNPFAEELMDIERQIGCKCLNFQSRVLDRYFTVEDLANKYGDKVLKDRLYFICGPKMMMDSMITGLMSHGVKKKNIFVEDYSFK